MQEQKVQFINPITGKSVDKYLKEKEAREQGYFDFQFMLKYLEDENEFIKFYIVEGVSILVDMDKPNLQYKKKLNLDYDRVLQTDKEVQKEINTTTIPAVTVCSLDDESCVSCSG